MSSYNDINQLLQEIGTSARSASDPWTLSRSNPRTVSSGAFTPAVVGDMGAPMQNLNSEIQSSEKIKNADLVASSPTGSSGSGGSSGGSGLLGGLMNFFPLASGIAKLFGFGGGSSSPPVLTPFEMPPSISFQGAMSSPTSGVSSLSYGENGLPKTSAPATNFTNAPAEMVSKIASQPATQANSGSLDGGSGAGTDFVSSGTMSQSGVETANVGSGGDVIRQFTGLTNSPFAFEPTGTASIPNSGVTSPSSSTPAGGVSGGSMTPDLGLQSLVQSPGGSAPSAGAPSSSGSSPSGSNSSSAQQGQSVLVQVQAMDSQSFMDRSQDIAQAVRQAMLNMNSLNDVILDL